MSNWPALTIFYPFAMTLRPSACWRNFGQVVCSRKVIGGGGGLPYRRRVVSLSTSLDLEAYRLAEEENGGGSGV